MKRIIPALLLLTFLLGACSSGNSSTQTASAEQSNAERNAKLLEVQNDVRVRASSNEASVTASIGMTILTGGSIETGSDGRAKIQLQPDGTILRVAPNSSFTLPILTVENGQPKTKVQLLFGKVFVLLKGGSLDIETPSGVASVRGSLLSVQYDPQKERIKAVCLEGHCALQDKDGDEVELIAGQSSFVEGDEDPSEPEMIDREDIQDWLDENPDLSEFMDELPDPEDYPEDSDEEMDGGENSGGEEEPESWLRTIYNI